MMEIKSKIKNQKSKIKGHSPSPATFCGGPRRIALRSQKRKHFGGAGQSITEYAVFITVVVMALLAMQIYLKRGIQGKIKDMAAYIGSESYNPNLTYSNYSSNQSVVYETTIQDGVLASVVLLDQTNTTSIDISLPEVAP